MGAPGVLRTWDHAHAGRGHIAVYTQDHAHAQSHTCSVIHTGPCRAGLTYSAPHSLQERREDGLCQVAAPLPLRPGLGLTTPSAPGLLTSLAEAQTSHRTPLDLRSQHSCLCPRQSRTLLPSPNSSQKSPDWASACLLGLNLALNLVGGGRRGEVGSHIPWSGMSPGMACPQDGLSPVWPV